jgi:hypothetical protein
LLERRRELAQLVADGERARTFASSDVERARQELSEAERARLNGGDPGGVTRAERALDQAKTAAQAPTAERLAGARAARRDVDGEIGRHVAANYPALSAEINEDARAAADGIDAALRTLLDAAAYRAEVDQRAISLWRWVGDPRPNLTPATLSGPATSAAEALLMAGGEPAPVLPDSYLPPDAVVVPAADDESADVGAVAKARP